MFANRSFTYAAAAPLDVAMTEMMDAPMASRMSTWSRRVRTGTTISPPPSPRSAPRKPATSETSKTMPTNSSGVIALRRRRDDAIAACGEHGADDEKNDADELRDGERAEETVVLRAHDLDEEALDAHEHEERAEDAAALVRALRQGQEDDEHDQRRRRFVELRRMDFQQFARQAV